MGFKNSLVVVSDKFINFSTHENVATFSDLKTILQKDNPIPVSHLIIGQGVPENQVDELLKMINNNIDSPHLIGIDRVKVKKSLVHKKSEANVLISHPVKTALNQFKSELMINESCSEMTDHVTGQHIQGNILFESARQMMMACVELYVIDKTERGQLKYTLNHVSVDYLKFAFPLSVHLIMDIHEHSIDKRGIVHLNLQVQFFQADEKICNVKCHATGYPDHLMERIEQRVARKTVARIKTNGTETTHS